MRITLIETGKTRDRFVAGGVEEFRKRLVRYAPFRIETLPDLKQSKRRSMKEVQDAEGRGILRAVGSDGFVVLLDERGRSFNSIAFAEYLNSLEGRTGHLFFVIGGPYGFSEEVYRRADEQLSLSPMTFSHQLVRVVFLEQLYRAFTILKGEPYHHA